MKDGRVRCDECKVVIIGMKKNADVEGFDTIVFPNDNWADPFICKSCRDIKKR